MSYRGKEVPFTSFTGGWVTNKPITELTQDQAADVDNIVIKHGGGFRSRFGDTEFNGTAMASGASVHGLGYYKQADTTEFLVAIAGTKIYSSGSSLGTTMTDRTGSLTITAGSDNIWTFNTFNNVTIAFGGSATSPDAPIQWSGSGNATALAGTPPSAYGAFQANNRMFAFRTAANPSTIYWSILGNQGDWTGTGSGSSEVWTSDNDSLTAAAILSTNTVLLFKENSIHQMQIGDLVSGAFPIYPAFKGVGCAGKHACVVADGMVYFITPQGKMKMTDGSKVYDESDVPALMNIDDQWQATNSSRWKYTQGIRRTGTDYDHILWLVSYGTAQTTHNRVFIWDLINKCWLQNSTGYAANCFTTTQAGVLYAGHYNGKIYKKDASTSTVTDASNSSTLIDGYWSSGWLHNSKVEPIQRPRKMSLSFATQSTGNIRVFWAFDFNGFTQQQNISQVAASGGIFGTSSFGASFFASSDFSMKPVRLIGRGNFFRFKIETPTESAPMQVFSINISGKESGQKETAAR